MNLGFLQDCADLAYFVPPSDQAAEQFLSACLACRVLDGDAADDAWVIATGGFCSPGHYHAMKQSQMSTAAIANNMKEFSCPWCSAPLADTAHIYWQCHASPRPAGLVPFDNLQRRLGWPTGDKARKHLDSAILQWMAAARREVLQHRYAKATSSS